MVNRYVWLAVGMSILMGYSVSVKAHEQEPPPGFEHEGRAFTFREIHKDIYHVVGTGNLAVGCNGAVIVNENDVLVVDSHMTPAAAWALLRELKDVTTKPVRYVVNTHFHFDHVHGNQAFPDDVQIIGHEFTRDMILSGGSTSGRAWDSYIGTLPNQIEDVQAELETTTDPLKRDELEKKLSYLKQFKLGVEAVVPTPPSLTLSKRMKLYRGEREIQLLFFGRGHTGGDVVVYLPKERVLITGDLLTAGLPYMGDGYLNEWVDTLEQLKKLDADVIVPGHGASYRETERIDHLQAYLRDLWNKTLAMHEKGIPAEEAARQIDMRDHAEHFPSITEVGVSPHAVMRVYDLLDAPDNR